MTDIYTRWILRGTDDTRTATRSAKRNFTDLDKTVQKVQRGFAALAGAGAITGVVAGIARAGEQMDSFERALTAATGSAADAVDQLQFVSDEADRLGLNLASTAEQFTKLTAAARGTRLEGQATRDIFTSIATASRVLNLSTDETAGALKAIEQIISKSTVSAEELRGQLGERLAGAFQTAAKSIGITTVELDKLLKSGRLSADRLLPALARELDKTFGAQAQSASRSLTGEINKLSNEMFRLKTSIAESGVLGAVTGLVKVMRGGVEVANDFGKSLREISLGDKALNEVQLLERELAQLSRQLGKQQSILDSGRFTRISGGTREATEAEQAAQRQRVLKLFDQIVDVEARLRDARLGAEKLELFDLNEIRLQRKTIENEFGQLYVGLTAASKSAYKDARDSILSASEALDEFIAKQRDLAADAATIFEATRTPVERFIAEVSKARDLLQQGFITDDTFERYKAQLLETTEAIEDIPTRASKSFDRFGNVFERSLAQYITRPTDDAFGGMVRSFEAALAQMAAELVSSQFVKLLEQLFGGAGGGSSASGGFLSGLAGAFAKAFLPGGGSVPSVGPAPPTNAPPVAQTIEVLPPPGVPLEVQSASVQTDSAGQFTQLVLGVVGEDLQQGGELSRGFEQKYGIAPALGAR